MSQAALGKLVHSKAVSGMEALAVLQPRVKKTVFFDLNAIFRPASSQKQEAGMERACVVEAVVGEVPFLWSRLLRHEH